MTAARASSRRTNLPVRPTPALRVPPSFEEEFRDASALATECFMNFGLVAGAVQAAVRRLLEGHGLPSMAAFNVLAILHGAGGPLSPSDIAERMVVSRPTMTGVVDSLAQRGLVRRSLDADDGRRRVIAPTKAGLAIVEEVLPHIHAFERDVMAGLTAAQQRQLLGLLAAIQAHFRTLEPDAELRISG